MITRVIEQIPAECELVIALGHQKEILKEYLLLAHPERTFHFVEVDRFEGEGAGPGYSLLCCKSHLDRPFYLTTCDTIVEEPLPSLEHNWVGLAEPRQEMRRYASAVLDASGNVIAFGNKGAGYPYPWIGLAGIRDHQTFWEALERRDRPHEREREVTAAWYRPEVYADLLGVLFTWLDTGNCDAYFAARALFTDAHHFDKWAESATYHVGDRAVKVVADRGITENLYRRAEILAPLVPPALNYGQYTYAYEWVPGVPLYQIPNPDTLVGLFDWCQTYLWNPKGDTGVSPDFQNRCRIFYHDKTYLRLREYYERYGAVSPTMINGVLCPPIEELLAAVDWDSLSQGTPSRIHGDLQFDNVLYTPNGYLLIDWREQFAGLLDQGDLYYDLGKLWGGVLISYYHLKRGLAQREVHGEAVSIALPNLPYLEVCRPLLEEKMAAAGFSMTRIKVIAALVHLNMAPLHQPPYGPLLLDFARYSLTQHLGSML